MRDKMLEAIFENFSQSLQLERAQEQMTLGELASWAESLSPDTPVLGLSSESDSYRGYYCDICFYPGETTAGELAVEARRAIGETYTGYKGGDNVMGKSTPVWVADYGCCGPRLMGFDGARAILKEEDA